MSNWNLNTKRAVVTGGSKGIGKAIVNEFVELGAEVLFTACNAEELKAAESEFANKGFKAHTLAGNVNDAEHRDRIAAWIRENWNGRLDILVNNAGINLRKHR